MKAIPNQKTYWNENIYHTASENEKKLLIFKANSMLFL